MHTIMQRPSKRRKASSKLRSQLLILSLLALCCIALINFLIFNDIIASFGDIVSNLIEFILYVQDTCVDFCVSIIDVIISLFTFPSQLLLVFAPKVEHVARATSVRVAVIAAGTSISSLPPLLNFHQKSFDCRGDDGALLKCAYLRAPSERASAALRADAVVFSTQGACSIAPRSSNYSHLRVYYAPPSAEWDACLDRHSFMANFDIEMSPRTCAQVPLYSLDSHLHGDKQLHLPPLEYTHKHNVVIYISCDPNNSKFSKLPINMATTLDAAGVPLEFKLCQRPSSNIQIMRKYKFCLVVESSSHTDYITQQLWDALVAGCVPIYIGAPNILDFLPHPNAAIVYGDGNINTPIDLGRALKKLTTNRASYESKLNWKQMHKLDYPPALAAVLHLKQTPRCHLCQLIARYKISGRVPFTCLWNSSWLKNPGAPQLFAGLN